jgi:hypothetical protein
VPEMRITQNTIRYGSQVFQIKNVTQTRVESWKENPKISPKALFFLFAIASGFFYLDARIADWVYDLFRNRPIGMGKFSDYLIGVFLLGIFAYGIWQRTQLQFYTLTIETNSGSSKLFSSRDKNGIFSVANTIVEVMEDGEKPANYSVTIDQSKITIGDSFQNIGSNTSITNRSTVS